MLNLFHEVLMLTIILIYTTIEMYADKIRTSTFQSNIMMSSVKLSLILHTYLNANKIKTVIKYTMYIINMISIFG